MRFAKHLGMLAMGVCAYFGSIGAAQAACTSTGTNQITCTGASRCCFHYTKPRKPQQCDQLREQLSCDARDSVRSCPGWLVTVSSISLVFHTYSAASGGGDGASRDVGIVLQSPDGKALQVISRIGSAATAQSNLTVTIADGGSALPAPPSTAWSTGGTFAPGNYSGT